MAPHVHLPAGREEGTRGARTRRQRDELGPGLADLCEDHLGLALERGRDLLGLVHAAEHRPGGEFGRAAQARRAQVLQRLLHLARQRENGLHYIHVTGERRCELAVMPGDMRCSRTAALLASWRTDAQGC